MCDLQGLPYCVLSQRPSRYLRMPPQTVMEESQTYTPRHGDKLAHLRMSLAAERAARRRLRFREEGQTI
jgi:hypothetical protein